MGSFLEKPRTEKETSQQSGNDLRAGVSAMQGWRVAMEDAHNVQIGVDGAPDYSWFAVYDGHGGSATSAYASKNLLSTVTSTQEWKERQDLNKLKTGIIKGFLQLDEDLRNQPEVSRGEDHSGSTAITAFVTPTHIVVGNCGDSRSILIKNKVPVEMSSDHKPYNEGEQKRIEKAGGSVTMKRVNGDLAVSRALGDFVYKHMKELRPEQQQVSAEPEVKVIERTDDDQFLVLACDGVWDVMTNEQVSDFILQKTVEGVDDMGEIAAELVDNCLNEGSRDNMSAIVVAFKNAPRPTKEAVAARVKTVAAQAGSKPPFGADFENRDSDDDDDDKDGERRRHDDEEEEPRIPEDIAMRQHPAAGESFGRP